jgi:hypothetical protein
MIRLNIYGHTDKGFVTDMHRFHFDTTPYKQIQLTLTDETDDDDENKEIVTIHVPVKQKQPERSQVAQDAIKEVIDRMADELYKKYGVYPANDPN